MSFAFPVTLVVAVARNGVIGAGGKLPWRLRSDLQRFRQLTLGKPVVMGRKTFESIGKPLDKRDNIVISRNRDFHAPGVIRAGSLGQALRVAEECARRSGADEICVIGGGQVFAEALPLAHRLMVTEVEADPEGDAYFPPIEAGTWTEGLRELLPRGEKDTASAVFVTYTRKRSEATEPEMLQQS